MQLENIEEDKEKFWAEHVPPKSESRGRSESLEVSTVPKPEQVRRGSNLLAAAGIDFERRRRQLHSPSLSGSISGTGGSGESRIFQDGDQWMEEKDGKVTKLELVEVQEKMGRMRKAVPLLPVPVAILLCILNALLPSLGTLIGVGTLLCGAKCRHEKTSQGVKYGILAAILQLLLTPIIVGWIFSIYYGANIVQDAITNRVTEPESEVASKTDQIEIP